MKARIYLVIAFLIFGTVLAVNDGSITAFVFHPGETIDLPLSMEFTKGEHAIVWSMPELKELNSLQVTGEGSGYFQVLLETPSHSYVVLESFQFAAKQRKELDKVWDAINGETAVSKITGMVAGGNGNGNNKEKKPKKPKK